MVLHWGRLSSRGHLAMSGDITCCRSLGGAERYWHLWAEAKDASKHLEVHRATPYNKELSDPKVNSAKVWKPRSR